MNNAVLTALRIDVQSFAPQVAEFFDIVDFRFITPEAIARRPILATIDTAAVIHDGVWFNPEFFATLPKPKQRGLVLHEIGHMVRADLSTPFTDSSLPTEEFRRLANIAQDLVIEGWIYEEYAVRLPTVVSQNYTEAQIKPYLGMSWIDVYRQLRKDMKGQPQSVDTHVPGQGPSHPQMAAQIERAARVSKARSVGSDHSDDTVVSPDIPVVDWRRALRDMWQRVETPAVPTYCPPSRRGVARGLLVPRMRRQLTGLGLEDLNIWIDVSGSMQDVLPTIVADIVNIAKTATVQRMRLHYYNERVLRVDVLDLERGSTVNWKKIPFGGGTDFDGAFRAYKKEVKIKRAPMVVLTDGEDSYNTPAADIREVSTSTVVLAYGRTPTVAFAPVLQVA